MMLSPLLAIGAILLGSGLALPSSAGHCGFSATATQMCNHKDVYTSLTIPQIFIGKTALTIKPNHGKRTTLSRPWHIAGLAEDFVAGFNNGSVVYSYGDDMWDGHEGAGFHCKAGAWSKEELDCGTADSRTQEMSCSFSCSASGDSNIIPTEPTLSVRSEDVFSVFSSLAVPDVSTKSVNATYAHGYCSFHLQLMHQCLHNPTELWHTEMLGNIFSIQDGDRKTVVMYPEGAGRIDERQKRLGSIGQNGLQMVFFHDQKTYFRFDGKSWDSGSKDDGNDKWSGVCRQEQWSREKLECRQETAGERRVSEMGCVFKC